MAIDALSFTTTILKSGGGAQPTDTGPTPGDFALALNDAAATQDGILKHRDLVRQQQEIMKRRILEVGMDAYVEEQKDIKKLTKILTLLAKDARDDIKPHLEEYLDHFTKKLPETPGEMFAYIQADIESIPKSAPDHLRDRMNELWVQIHKMMTMPDDLVESLDKSPFDPV